jgi:hypothetical protein
LRTARRASLDEQDFRAAFGQARRDGAAAGAGAHHREIVALGHG